jgi:hypothetical protein
MYNYSFKAQTDSFILAHSLVILLLDFSYTVLSK